MPRSHENNGLPGPVGLGGRTQGVGSLYEMTPYNIAVTCLCSEGSVYVLCTWDRKNAYAQHAGSVRFACEQRVFAVCRVNIVEMILLALICLLIMNMTAAFSRSLGKKR